MDAAGSQPLRLAPFRALTYAAADALDRLTCPPYDVVGANGIRAYEDVDTHNVVRLILPRAGDHETRYEHAARELRAWLARGVLHLAERPALFVYEHQTSTGSAVGFVGCIPLDAPLLPHERTFAEPVADRAALMTATGAQFEPILLTYSGGGAASDILDAATAEPAEVETQTDEGRHRVWRLTDTERLATIAAGLAGHQALIADGHHRFAAYQQVATALTDGPADHTADDRADGAGRQGRAGDGAGFGLAMLVDSSRHPLGLRAVHRSVTGLAPRAAIERARGAFEVDEFAHPGSASAALHDLARRSSTTGAAFVVGAGDHWAVLHSPRPRAIDAAMPSAASATWRSLDSAVVTHLLLEQLWHVGPGDQRVRIHHDAGEAAAAAVAEGGTAVVLRPPELADVMALARRGERMPQKSTSFGPKPRTGFLMRLTRPVLASAPHT